MDASPPTPQETPAKGDRGIFPFLKLPGEIRNKCYGEVLRLYEPGKRFPVSKTANVHTQAKQSTALTLTQVSRKIRAELLPLVLARRRPQVPLTHLAEYLRVFYHNADTETSACTDKQTATRDPDQQPLKLLRHGELTVWTSQRGLHSKLPSEGINLYPIIDALLKCNRVRADFHSWCIFNWELHIVETLYKSYYYHMLKDGNRLLLPSETWQRNIYSFGIESILLQTEHGTGGYPRGRLSSSLIVRCTATEHTSEKNRVEDLAMWVYYTDLWKVHKRVAGLTIRFSTPKTLRGQATEVKFSVYPSSVKLEWWCRGSYCKARLVDDGCKFRVERKMVIGKDVLRL